VSERRRYWLILMVIAAALLLSACAAGANPAAGTAPEGESVAGFWLGLWQGIISPIAFVVSLFNDGVNVYEVHNNGNWYNFGFIIGAVMLIGGSHGARSSGR